MAAPTTLLEYATQQRDARVKDQTEAPSRLSATQLETDAVRKAYANETARYEFLEKDERAIRTLLSAVPTSADGEALLDRLQYTVIAKRTSEKRIVDADVGSGVAEAKRDAANAEIARSAAARAEAETMLSQETERATRRAAWAKKLSEAPLSTLRADANDAVTKAPFTAAKARLEKDIPAALLARARERRALEMARWGGIVAASTSAARAASGPPGSVEQASFGLSRAERALQDYMVGAKERYDAALVILSRVASPDSDPLTPEATKSIQALAAQGAASLAEEKKVDAKRQALHEKDEARRKAILEAKAHNLDPEVDPISGAGAAVAGAQTEADKTDLATKAKQKDLDDAET